MMNVREAGGREECLRHRRSRDAQEASPSPGRYKTIAKRICRVVKYPMESTSAAASSRAARLSLDFTAAAVALEACGSIRGRAGHLACGVAVAEQRPDRHRPSCSLQSLRQARDEDRVPAGLSKSIVQSQRRLEHGPADRKHLLALRDSCSASA